MKDFAYYQSIIKLNNTEQKLMLVDYLSQDNQSKRENGKVQYHHIQIIDRSGSMYSYINELIDNLQDTLTVIDPNDLLSIIWFSGPGQYRTLVKGAKKTDNLTALLDSIRSTLLTTCFSEPLMEAEKLIEELTTLCPNFSLTLFTDGCPVIPWGEHEEIRRIKDIMKRLSTKLVSCVTIGYGYYYNQLLLLEIAEFGKQGKFFHASNIDDYLSYFKSNYQNLKSMGEQTVTFKDFMGTMLHLTPTSHQFYIRGISANVEDLTITLYKDKNFFFILDKNPSTGFKMNDITLKQCKKGIIAEIPAHFLEQFFYSYAYQRFYEGNKEESLNILANNLHDKNLVDRLINVYTYDERGEFLKDLESCIYAAAGRYKTGKCNDNYIPADDCLCVMDILKVLAEGDCYYLPGSVKDYKRIGKKHDSAVKLFEYSKEETRVPFGNFVFNEKFLNMSQKIFFKGKVHLNPKQAEDVGLSFTEVDGISRFKTHTIVKDGNLNIKKFDTFVDMETMKKLNEISCGKGDRKLSFITDTQYPPLIGDNFKGECRVSFDFIKLPIINKEYVKGKCAILDSIFDTTMEMLTLECKQKVLNYYIKKIKGDVTVARGIFEGMNEAQIALLKSHGITEERTFNDPFAEVAEKDQSKLDFYMARTFEVDIKGKKTIPSVSDVLKRVEAYKNAASEKEKEKKKLKGLTLIMADYIEYFKFEHHMAVGDKRVLAEVERCASVVLKGIRKDLQKLRMMLAIVKMGKVLSNSWFDNLNLSDNGNYEFKKNGELMIIKLGREKVYF